MSDTTDSRTRWLALYVLCLASLMIVLEHEVGALHKALAPFRKYHINMTKIESRPNKRKKWEYFFFIDCDGHRKRMFDGAD